MSDADDKINDSEDKDDLTRIENLSEYEHLDDTSVDRVLDKKGIDKKDDDSAPSDESDLEEPEIEEEESIFDDKDDKKDDKTEQFSPSDIDEEPEPEEAEADTEIEEPPEFTQQISTESIFNTSEEDDDNSQVVEEEFTYTEPEEIQHHKSEGFEDIQHFGESICTGTISSGGNPPFALIVQNIRYIEDSEDIVRILRDFKIINKTNEETIVHGVQNGSVLISQISEYAAITLAHRFRQYDVDIKFGLSEQLHPSKSCEISSRGLVSKYNLHQNKMENLNLTEKPVKLESIILTTTPTLQNYQIIKYIDLVSEHTVIGEDKLEAINSIHDDKKKTNPFELNIFDNNQADQDGVNEVLDRYCSSLNEIYTDLAEKIRQKAFKKGGNAIVGINFQISPLLHTAGEQHEGMEFQSPQKNRYKISCIGNIVIVK
ncbi:MAG: hypothetical protein KAQ98_04445 [Bacteriovoracaceae bacterium]|nr:hypothetical protein [Bacteriovoracaceae bacterium]